MISTIISFVVGFEVMALAIRIVTRGAVTRRKILDGVGKIFHKIVKAIEAGLYERRHEPHETRVYHK